MQRLLQGIKGKEKRYFCEICNKNFKRFSHATDHERIHSGEKPFCCKVCAKEFNHLGNFKRHQMIHSRDKPYMCKFCNKRFKRLGHVNDHERIHNGEKPFRCNLCAREFNHLGNLRRHEINHNGTQQEISIHQVLPPDSSTSSLTSTIQRSKQSLTKQADKHQSIVVLKQKSDCETKMDKLQHQILSHDQFEFRQELQDRSCLELPSAFTRCRECKSATTKLSQVLCRFHSFRRSLKLNSKGGIVKPEFLSPMDASPIDLALWMPMLPLVDPQIDVTTAKYIIESIGKLFCDLTEQEKEAMSWVSGHNEIVWKPAVNGIREMCDVCSTTLFNLHCVCCKCGYAVCLDCCRTMMRRCSRCHDNVVKGCKACSVLHVKRLKCSINHQPHQPREMMVTQIIPSDVLLFMGQMIHNIREKWNICSCGEDGDITSNLSGNLDCDYVPHVWLDGGRVLQLLKPHHPRNVKMFQKVWQKGKPIMISNCDKHITKELWLPEVFAKEFGNMENDLVDCTHNVVLIGHKMKQFWQGFENVSARLKDSHNEPMVLKLKDWPPMEDFSEMLPIHFRDLMQGLPLPEYTHRTGVFNIASRLPEYFVRPDLGPKMYNAYGSALHPMVGSTNLHLDISDAVNLILYVGIPKDDTEDHEAAAIKGMRTAGCCEPTMTRITQEGHKPGALWHIFDARDSDKIRDLLIKVGFEIGEPVEPNHDPIHDQSWYLDEALRERLLKEYSVQGYTLVQCVGDAIFIPAGAPHQVRNFHSCIKAAEDFVSPENLSHCVQLTQEFRQLSNMHSNHEDKLQVKNIIYHSVKDAIAVLQNTEPGSLV